MSNVEETIGKLNRGRKRKSSIQTVDSNLEKEPSKVYLKAMPLRKLSDVKTIKHDVESGNIIIVKVSALANKSIEDVKQAVNELCEFIESVNGDIARLGEERIVVTPPGVRIWREKHVTPEEQVPTAA